MMIMHYIVLHSYSEMMEFIRATYLVFTETSGWKLLNKEKHPNGRWTLNSSHIIGSIEGH